ncbi:unnamed protein product [Rhodiola kirilowii]
MQTLHSGVIFRICLPWSIVKERNGKLWELFLFTSAQSLDCI